MFSLILKVLFLITSFLRYVMARESLPFHAVFNDHVAPFKIEVDPEFIANTVQRVSLSRLPLDIGTEFFSEGLPVENATSLQRFWTHDYKWSEVEQSLNKQ